MSLVSRHIPALFNGISQQPATLRQPAQGEAQVNCYATVADGLKKRPPFEHSSLVTAVDISTAFVHTINRDVTERYVVVVTDGDLKVYDADTGAEKTVLFPQGKLYLDVVGNANSSFALVSIADYTFVVNKEKVVATKTSPTTTPLYYNDWYQPDIWGPRTATRYYNPSGAGVLTGTVNVFSDLPKATDPVPPSNGDLYKVVGYDENNFGGYYVRRSGGVWVETYGPGANTSLDETTMPWALVRNGDGTFTFTTFAWKARQFGDAETNPGPTFIGRAINDVFYWKNRLGFLTDENVVFSGAGDYGNFWRNTLTTLLDSDVVDVAVSTTKVSLLEFAIPFNGGLMLFADQTQFSLNVADLLTPTSVSIDEVTSYEMDKGVRPVGIGSDVYFVTRSGPYSRIREYFVSPDNLSLDAADITAHVPRYLPKGIFKLAGNGNEDVLFAISNEPGYRNRIYVYKFFWQGDQKLQSSWSYWELDSNDTILSIAAIEDTLYALIKRADGTYLEKCVLDDGAVAVNSTFNILLDRRYNVQAGNMVYNAGLDETTITVPYNTQNLTQANFKIAYTLGTGNKGRLEPQSGYQFEVVAGYNQISVPGDVRTYGPVVGVNYESNFQFSEQFIQDAAGNAITTGRLQLRTFTLYYQDAGFFQVKVYPYGTDFAGLLESVVPASLDAFTGRTLGTSQLEIGEATFDTGAYTFYIDGNSRDVDIQLINPTHLQAKFSSCEWEGLWFNRSRSV